MDDHIQCHAVQGTMQSMDLLQSVRRNTYKLGAHTRHVALHLSPRNLTHPPSLCVLLYSLFRGFMYCDNRLYLVIYGAYQWGAPHSYGDDSLCTVMSPVNSLLTRIFQWVGFAYDPARNEIRIYLQTPFGTVESRAKCRTMPDPGLARNNYVAAYSTAYNPSAQMTHVSWFDMFLTYETKRQQAQI
jgi:hypothetical protein